MNYYNEFDPKKAAWLRELIRQNVVAPGIVDERSIADVRPADLEGYAQCHFFAGIGIWSYALRLSGWADDEPVWTGSCPCQPFSAAGKRKGKADERHLFPAWFRLISERHPVVIFGEQVSSRDGLAWFDDVRSDLEASSYTVGANDLCSAGFGATDLRQRLYFVADSETSVWWTPDGAQNQGRRAEKTRGPGSVGIVEHTARNGRHERRAESGERGTQPRCSAVGMAERDEGDRITGRSGSVRIVADNDGEGCGIGGPTHNGNGHHASGDDVNRCGEADPVNGFWRDAHWVLTRPERVGGSPGLRAVEPGTFPLDHGAANRVLKLRGYGDGINAEVAAAFIRAYMEVRSAWHELAI